MESLQKSNMFKKVFPVIIGVIVFFSLYSLMIALYSSEGNAGELKVFKTEMFDSDPDHMLIYAKLISIDLLKGEVLIRLQFIPEGDLVDKNGVSLTSPISLDINSATGKNEINYKKGDRMNPVDLVVSLYDGDLMDYPFDEHTADSIIGLSTYPENEQSPNEYTAIPFEVIYSGAVSGYSIIAKESQDVETGYIEFQVIITRSVTVLFFAIFIMVLQWLLAIVSLSVSLDCLITGRKIEATLFSWMGALLFALVPLRNAMPGVPPVGALTDYIAFFWAEILVAVSLVIFVYTYLSRPLK